MNSLKKIFDFYIYSNIHVAIAGFCITKITLLKFGFYTNLVPLFVGLSIIVSYNFIRYFEIDSKRLGWFKRWVLQYKNKLVLLMTLSLLIGGYIIFFTGFNIKSLFILIPFGFMTLFYTIPLFKIGKLQVSFRNFPAIKIFSIAIAWSGITVLFPLSEVNYIFTTDVYIEFFQRILILIAITIPFDIRDIYLDDKKLKTLPQLLGVHYSKVMGTMLLFFFVLLGSNKTNYSNNNLLVDIIITLISLFFLWNSSPKKSRYYTSFFVEAIPILWFLIVLVFL